MTGNYLVWKSTLIKDFKQITLKGIDISFAINISILVGTVQGPEDFEPSRLLMISMISWGVVGENKHSVPPPPNFGRETEFLKNLLWGRGGPDPSTAWAGAFLGRN